MGRKTLKKIGNIAGRIISLASIVFIFLKISQTITLSEFQSTLSAVGALFFLCVFFWFLSLSSGIYGWHLLVKNYAKKQVGFLFSYYYFAKTQIAKYLPGNVFHFVSRQLIAEKVAITQKNMLKINFFHSVLQVVAALGVSIVFLTHIFYSSIYYIPIFIGYLFAMLVLWRLFPDITLSIKLKIYLVLTLGTLCSSAAMVLIVSRLDSNFNSSVIVPLVGIYLLSWLIGYIVPGASGGIGVREAAFIFLIDLGQLGLNSEIVLLSIVLLRLVSIFTDILTYLSGFFARVRAKSELKF